MRSTVALPGVVRMNFTLMADDSVTHRLFSITALITAVYPWDGVAVCGTGVVVCIWGGFSS